MSYNESQMCHMKEIYTNEKYIKLNRKYKENLISYDNEIGTCMYRDRPEKRKLAAVSQCYKVSQSYSVKCDVR